MKIIYRITFCIFIFFIIFAFLYFSRIIYKNSDSYTISACLDSAKTNYDEIKKALDYFPKNSEKYNAMMYLVKNMRCQYSYTDNINHLAREILYKNPPKNLKNLWNMVSSSKQKRPVLKNDLQVVTSEYLINNLEEAYKTWKEAPWSNEICFEHFCEYILPYKIGEEPIVSWRTIFKKKYSPLIKNVKSQKEAYNILYKYIIKEFKVGDICYPYKQDVIMLDMVQIGSCDLRTLYMVHIFKSLGICASYDYTPAWSNHGKNGHSWSVFIEKDNKISTCSKDTINYIDGSYEKSIFSVNKNDYPYSIDSLKKVAKVYRKTFTINNNAYEDWNKDVPDIFKDVYSREVTSLYLNLTTNNVIDLKKSYKETLYLCTFQQDNGWIPISKVKKLKSTKIDVGPLIHDNVIVIAKYIDGAVIPISNPFIISHHHKPRELSPNRDKTQTIRVLRKYILNNRWINRWGEIIGTKIEESNNEAFSCGINLLWQIDNIPTERIRIMFNKDIMCNYIRIKPEKNMFPVFAEIKLIDKQGCHIPKNDYRIFAIGKGLTGDSIVVNSLSDDDLMTTFYKRFPFWIGFDITKCKQSIEGIELILWNDMNQIIPNQEYELFYFKQGWNSIKKDTATENYLIYNNIPYNALFLLKNYTMGNEERIFIYENNKQIWF